MGLLSVVVAGVAAWIFGAIWYSIMAKPWMEASGVPLGADGKPANQKNPLPYIASIIAAILVAGMMRHTFATSAVDTVWEGIVSGFGVGAFLALPWVVTCYGFAGRPVKLMVIDGIYITVGCTLIGLVLMLL